MLKSMTLLLGLATAYAQNIKLAWNANPETDIVGYVVSYGTQSGNLDQSLDVGNKTEATLAGLPLDIMHYASVQAYNTAGLFSIPSAEVSFTPRMKPPVLVMNEKGLSQPLTGNVTDFGMVRVGALSETRSFTVTNTGTTTLSGLRFEIDGGLAGNFSVSNIPVNSALLRNGDFEQNLEHWAATGSVRSSVLSSASSGTRVARMGAEDQPNTGDLKQTFSTVAGKTYLLSMDVAVEATNTKFQTLRTSVEGNKTLLTDDYTLNRPIKDVVTWTTRTLNFTADSSATTIIFANTSAETLRVDLLLDRVRITDPVSAQATTPQTLPSIAPGRSLTFTVAYSPTVGGPSEAQIRLVADQVSVALFESQLKGSPSIPLDHWLAQYNIVDGPFGNHDRDDLNNLQEYAFGRDPLKNQGGAVSGETGKLVVRGTPSVRVLSAAQGGFQGLFARRKDHAVMNLRYTPQFSADLTQWMNATESPVEIGTDGEMELLAVKAPASINGKQARFFRVGVIENAPPTYAEWLAGSNASGGNNGNPDADALNNLQEFAFGTDPKAANGQSVSVINGLIASRGAPAPRVIQGPTPEFHGMFARRKEPDGVKYRPQFSADLNKWVDSSTTPVKLADDGEIEVVSVAGPASIDGNPTRFFRLGVVK